MSKECECIEPQGGGTTCPSQHIALCIRGKDMQCYGECIPIPDTFDSVSESFTFWAQNTVKEKIVEHALKYPKIYYAPQIFREVLHTFEKENIDSLPIGKSIYRNEVDGEISVSYSFSFKEETDQLEREKTLNY